MFVSVIASVPAPVELVMTQAADHFRTRLMSQLIKGISRVLQKIMKLKF